MVRQFVPAAGAAALLLLSTTALTGCGRAKADVGPPPPPEVTVANPLVQAAPSWTEYAGRFVAVEAVDVRPRISGYLKSVHFKDGDYVHAGQLLFTLDPLPSQAKVDQSSAELMQVEARLEKALADLRRAETLRAADAISQEELEIRKEAASQARAAKAAAQAALRANRLDLGYTRIYAPISGRISDRRVDPGNLVQNGETVLTQIVSMDPIHFEFAAPEELQAQAQALGSSPRQVLVKLEGEDAFTHPGRLDFVDNRISPTTGALRARAVLSNTGGRFTPGQFGRIRILSPETKPVLLAPETAISADQSRKVVMVVNRQNKVEPRLIEVGPRYGDLRVVTKGLTPQDRIIINGLQRAMPGTPVTPQPGKIAPASAQG